MHKFVFLSLSLLLFLFACGPTQTDQAGNDAPDAEQATSLHESSAPSIATVDFAGLQDFMAEQEAEGELVVYNFWATWCRPCVAELPAFTKLHQAYADRGIKVVLVSLDFPDKKQQMEQFVAERDLQPAVIHLDDPDQDVWINGISPEWSGAIPATLLKGPAYRAFKEQGFTYEELQAWVDEALAQS